MYDSYPKAILQKAFALNAHGLTMRNLLWLVLSTPIIQTFNSLTSLGCCSKMTYYDLLRPSSIIKLHYYYQYYTCVRMLKNRIYICNYHSDHAKSICKCKNMVTALCHCNSYLKETFVDFYFKHIQF